jgi:hypothetical protein
MAAAAMIVMNLSPLCPHQHRRVLSKLGLPLTTTTRTQGNRQQQLLLLARPLLAEILLVVAVGGFRRCSLDDEARLENRALPVLANKSSQNGDHKWRAPRATHSFFVWWMCFFQSFEKFAIELWYTALIAVNRKIAYPSLCGVILQYMLHRV